MMDHLSATPLRFRLRNLGLTNNHLGCLRDLHAPRLSPLATALKISIEIDNVNPCTHTPVQKSDKAVGYILLV
jgi:hypothetical protein